MGVFISLIFLTAFKEVRSIPGFTTSGNHFVLACTAIRPWVLTRNSCGNVYITTENWNVTVSIKIGGGTKELQDGLFVVSRDSPKKYVNKESELVKTAKIFTGKFKLLVIRSSSTVKVVQLEKSGQHSSFIKLIPKQSCYKKYFLTTATGYPTMTVHSFNRKTNLIIKFGNLGNWYKEQCYANILCQKNSEVGVNLVAYQAWRFSLKGWRYTYEHTIIIANEPVFVVSGNIQFLLKKRGKNDVDGSVSSMVPVETWGTQYMVSAFPAADFSKPVKFSFLSLNFPLHVIFFTSTGRLSKKMERSAGYYNVKISVDAMMLITSSVSFGLYMHYPFKSGNRWGADVSPVIPLEQWTHGLLYIPSGIDYETSHALTYLLLSTADPRILITSGIDKSIIKWRKVTSIRKISYWSATFDRITGITEVYAPQNSGKLILYVKLSADMLGTSIFPYDFYLGNLDSTQCVEVKPLASDGVDNDCDGFIDEEIENDVDDDGDGKVDEDVVQPHQHGAWADWTEGCVYSCGSINISTRYIRSCSNPTPSMFGNVCIGESEKCEPKEVCAKTSCADTKQELVTDCVCQKGCADCGQSSRSYICSECKPGYFPSRFCLDPCPSGWSGMGCVDGPKKLTDFIMINNNNTYYSGKKLITTTTLETTNGTTQLFEASTGESFGWIAVVIPSIIVLGCLGLVSMCVVKRDRLKRAETLEE